MIKINKIKPMFTSLLVTMDKYDDYKVTGSGLLDASRQAGSLKEFQKVVAVGSTVRDINVGDVVWVNPTRFAVMKHKKGSLQDGVIGDNQVLEYKFDTIKMGDGDYLLLQDRDIDFIVEEYEEIEDAPPSTIIKLSTIV